MSRRWIVLLLFLAGVATWWFVSRPDPLPPGTSILVERRAEPPDEVTDTPAAVLEPPRELEIRGLVFGADPLAYRIRIGEEESRPNDRGEFDFPPAVRPRWSDVELWRDGELVARERALTGDPTSGDPVEDPSLARFPERPARIRWSWNLFPRENEDDVDVLGIDGAFGEEWGRGGRVILRGRTAFPDGARLNGNLRFERLRFIASLDPAVVDGGAFTLEIFCPLDMVFYAGEYRAQVVFNTVLQTAEFRREAAEAAGNLTAGGEALSERRICFGEPERARREDLAAQRYYARGLDEAARSEEVLKARVEEVRRGAMDWDPSLFVARDAARAGWFHEPLLDDAGKFDVKRWRRFLDEEWRPHIRALLDEHRARGQEKYMEAADHMGRVLGSLHDLSYMYSRFQIYPLVGLPPASEDWYEDAYEGGDIALAERTLRRSTEELQRYRALVDSPLETTHCGEP